MPSYPELMNLIKSGKNLPDDYQSRRQAMDGERRLSFLRPSTDNPARKNFATFIATIATQMEINRSHYASWDKKYSLAHPEEFSRQLDWRKAVAVIHQEAMLGAFFVARQDVVAEYNNNEERAATNSSLVQSIDKSIGTGYTPEQVLQCAEALKRVFRVLTSNVDVKWHPMLDNKLIEAKIDDMIRSSQEIIAAQELIEASAPCSSASMSC